MAGANAASSTFLLPDSLTALTAIATPLTAAEQSLVQRASAGEPLQPEAENRAIELAARNLRLIFPRAPIYDRTFPLSLPDYDAAYRGIRFDFRAAGLALGASSYVIGLGTDQLPGWNSFLTRLKNRNNTHSLEVLPPLERVPEELRRFGWFTFHATRRSRSSTTRLVETVIERQAENDQWYATNSDLVDALTASLLRESWGGDGHAAHLLRRLSSEAFEPGVYPYRGYVTGALADEIRPPWESPARQTLARYEAEGYLFHGGKLALAVVEPMVPRGIMGVMNGRDVVQEASISASPSASLSGLYALSRHRGASPGFCTHPRPDGQVGVSLGLLPETKLAALALGNTGAIHVLRPDAARPRPSFFGEFYYGDAQEPVDVVTVTPNDFLDHLLDAPTKPRGSHPFHDISAPCALGGSFSFTCPKPGTHGWPTPDDPYPIRRGKGWMAPGAEQGDDDVPLNVPNRAHGTHSFRRYSPYRPGAAVRGASSARR